MFLSPGDGAVVRVHDSLQVGQLQEGLMEVMQVNDAHLQDKCHTVLPWKHRKR